MSSSLHFVRHAETLFNVEHQLQGWCDSPLTERGERQIVALGERMRDIPLAAAFTSDLTRTRTTTAAALTGHPALEPVSMTELREWHFGGFEGKPNASLWESVFADHGYTYVPNSADWPAMTEQGLDSVIDSIHRNDGTRRAETSGQVRTRIRVALRHITDAARNGDVLVVTHGTVLGSILREINPGHRPRAGFPNCGIVTVTDGRIDETDASCAVD